MKAAVAATRGTEGGLVSCTNDGFERRARIRTWGIEVEVWRLVETLTLPMTAAALPIKSLFPTEARGAIPTRNCDDEKTLENLTEPTTLENEVELVYQEPGGGTK